jgi:nitrile hydratase
MLTSAVDSYLEERAIAMTSFDSRKISRIHHDLRDHLPSDPALRTKALESLLTEKRLVDPAAIDAWIEMYRDEIGPKRGAVVVARAWRDPAFKERLLADATAAIGELGFAGHATGHLEAVENTTFVHNLVVCTLCSCYPFSILGMSPAWYKSNEYRARAVRDPRGVLTEFGVELDDAVEVRVWDSTSERRYLVLPQKPVGVEGWDEDALARLVTRNSMIGTERTLSPSQRNA